MRRGRRIIVYCVLGAALGAGVARGEVEAKAVAPGVRAEKIFHYEEGVEIINELAERGVSLADLWPGLYAVDFHGYFGENLTLFDGTGKVTREYVFDDQPAASETFFPAANGKYYLGARDGIASLEYRGDPPRHSYYNRAGEVLWRDGTSEEIYWGWIGLSPNGEEIAYVQGNAVNPEPDSKVTLKDKNGSIIAEHTVPYSGEFFGFSDDGDYLLVSESLWSRRSTDFGTAVFNKAGEFLFPLDPEFEAGISWGTRAAVVGGSDGYFYQVGYKVERRKTSKGIVVVDKLLDMGPFLEIYDSSGKKRWEVNVSQREWGAALSGDGRLIAHVPADPGDELVVAELATGKRVNTLPFSDASPEFPLITLSNNGNAVCISCVEQETSNWYSWASLYSATGELICFDADKAGSFHLTADGDYVVFCGARALAVFEIKTDSN